MRDVIELAEDQEFIRNELKRLDLVSFAADGSVLPRETGHIGPPDERKRTLFFPESLKITLNLPHHGPFAAWQSAEA